ncbi:hypothetical protein EVAR_94188_1 [Eumeta japonica]|uniref:Uncharacterized protein n=1 Tax=Eumeta variegata TaxID=151549 RepID=A0A4C1UMZ4_EUMVA|nr:hypothetical protein EVAR_94188_1 [Eumeta japonica]
MYSKGLHVNSHQAQRCRTKPRSLGRCIMTARPCLGRDDAILCEATPFSHQVSRIAASRSPSRSGRVLDKAFRPFKGDDFNFRIRLARRNVDADGDLALRLPDSVLASQTIELPGVL